jgi:hypothetical protein
MRSAATCGTAAATTGFLAPPGAKSLKDAGGSDALELAALSGSPPMGPSTLVWSTPALLFCAGSSPRASSHAANSARALS